MADLESLFEGRVRLRSGEDASLRLLRPEDSLRFGEYLANLSAATRSRWAPHGFDQETADQICTTLNPSEAVRLIATVPTRDEERIIAYFILVLGLLEDDIRRYRGYGIPLNPEEDCTFAPCVADEYQDQGVGRAIADHVIEAARRLGRDRMLLMGGVIESNRRAVHFYERLGFRKVGEFDLGFNNYDMMLEL